MTLHADVALAVQQAGVLLGVLLFECGQIGIDDFNTIKRDGHLPTPTNDAVVIPLPGWVTGLSTRGRQAVSPFGSYRLLLSSREPG